MLRALHECIAVVEGGVTNRCFLIRLLEQPEFQSSQIDTGWIDRLMKSQALGEKRYSAEALATVAILLHEARLQEEELNFFASAARGRAVLSNSQHGPIEICSEGINHTLEVSTLGSRLYRVESGGISVDLRLRPIGPQEVRVTDATGRSWKLIHSRAGQEWILEIEGELHRLSNDPGGFLRAPSPGLVMSCFVEEGAEVQAGDRLIALEAMKTEFPVLLLSLGLCAK